MCAYVCVRITHRDKVDRLDLWWGLEGCVTGEHFAFDDDGERRDFVVEVLFLKREEHGLGVLRLWF
jgi:hypothetical protein